MLVNFISGIGKKTDAAATIGDTTPFSVIAMLKGIYNKISNIASSVHDNVIQDNIIFTGIVQQLSNIPCKSFNIVIDADNTNVVYVGNANVSTSVYMYKMAAKDTTSFTISNTNLLYVLGTLGEKLSIGGEV